MLFFANSGILSMLKTQSVIFGGAVMSKVCSVCGKGKLSGNLVSHSNRKTPRLYSANVQKVRVVNDGVVSSEYVCARCLKSKKVERA